MKIHQGIVRQPLLKIHSLFWDLSRIPEMLSQVSIWGYRCQTGATASVKCRATIHVKLGLRYMSSWGYHRYQAGATTGIKLGLAQDYEGNLQNSPAADYNCLWLDSLVNSDSWSSSHSPCHTSLSYNIPQQYTPSLAQMYSLAS